MVAVGALVAFMEEEVDAIVNAELELGTEVRITLVLDVVAVTVALNVADDLG